MASLHTEQLDYLLQHLLQSSGGAVVAGVFPADCVPTLHHRSDNDVCFVLNTDRHGLPGAHWLAFYYDNDRKRLEYFDSFGQPLSLYRSVSQSLGKRRYSILPMNTHGMLQALDSTACGYYCVLYLYYRMRFRSGVVAANKIARLARTANARDNIVVRKVHKLMHTCRCSNMPLSSVCTSQSQSCKCYTNCTNARRI